MKPLLKGVEMKVLKEIGYLLFALLGGVFLTVLVFTGASQDSLYTVGTFYITGLLVLFAAASVLNDKSKD
jgi:hypothetical protein